MGQAGRLVEMRFVTRALIVVLAASVVGCITGCRDRSLHLNRSGNLLSYEDKIYADLQRTYRLKIYRPRYLPPGVTSVTSEVVGTEARVTYRSSKGCFIELFFGVKGDIGIPPAETISVAGHKAYVAEDRARRSVTIAWMEQIEGNWYLYGLNTVNLPKEDALKVVKSLYLYRRI